MSQQSTPSAKRAKAKSVKPDKPRKDFPLFPHDGGVWAKKVRGKMHYFGPWDDPQGALERWLREKDDLLAGRTPRPFDEGALTVADLCDLFLESRERRVETGELSQRTFDDYFAVAKSVTQILGRNAAVEHLRPSDFASLRAKLAKGCNLKTLEGRVACTRAIFNYADKNGLIERSLSRLWGTEFAKPSRTALTKLANQTERLFTAGQVRKLITAASPQVRAMMFLGINGGFGNTDVASLKQSDIDFRSGWLNLPRIKTGKPRRCPLWPETIEALKAAIEKRPKPKLEEHADLVFVTKYGDSWLPEKSDNPLTKEFAKIRKRVGITGRGKSFYTLRHCFQTVGDETRDFIAVSALMGHAPQTISDNYREKIGDDRLRAVVDHVHDWLYPLVRIEAIEGGAK